MKFYNEHESTGSGLFTWKEGGLRRRLRHHQAVQSITVCHDAAVSCLRHGEGLLEMILVLGLAGGQVASTTCLGAPRLL